MKGNNIVFPASVLFGAISALASTLNPRTSSIKPVTIKGNAFFTGNDRFYIRGVDYQPGNATIDSFVFVGLGLLTNLLRGFI